MGKRVVLNVVKTHRGDRGGGFLVLSAEHGDSSIAFRRLDRCPADLVWDFEWLRREQLGLLAAEVVSIASRPRAEARQFKGKRSEAAIALGFPPPGLKPNHRESLDAALKRRSSTLTLESGESILRVIERPGRADGAERARGAHRKPLAEVIL
jgi:hypothetical protein